MVEVKLDSYGFAYVRLYIKPKDAPLMDYLSYKVDTGASNTTINKNKLSDFGFDEDWVKDNGRLLEGDERPSVATGEPIDNCYKVSLPEINIGGFVGYNWPFLVSLNEDIQFRLLLGIDSMQFFNWTFDYSAGVCRFDLIPDKRTLLFNRSEQSIHALDEI